MLFVASAAAWNRASNFCFVKAFQAGTALGNNYSTAAFANLRASSLKDSGLMTKVRPAFFHGSKALFMSSSSDESGEYDYDYLVIGAGSGGIATARRAAGYGAKVAVVEKG